VSEVLYHQKPFQIKTV